ncbi:MAG: nitroreductase family protein [Infirmifilum sp.]
MGIARILYHIQGIRVDGFRTVPSAGATYPLVVYVSAGDNFIPLKRGLYKYIPTSNTLEQTSREADFEGFKIKVTPIKTTSFYGSRGFRYIRQEVGHALLNLFLSLVSHGFNWKTSLLDLSMGDDIPEVEVAEVEVKAPERFCKGFLIEPGLSLDEVIAKRSSQRSFRREGITEEQLLTILKWSLGRVIEGGRVYPKIFREYLVEAYVTVRLVRGLEPGVYYFNSQTMRLEPIKSGDFSEQLWMYSLRQQPLLKSPATIILSGSGYEAEVESGVVGQSIYLNVTHEGLGTVAIGAFEDENIARVTGIENPLYLMPIGKPFVP